MEAKRYGEDAIGCEVSGDLNIQRIGVSAKGQAYNM